MAENFEHASDRAGPAPKHGDLMAKLQQTTLSRDEYLVFEGWLKGHLNKLYKEVLKEPLPSDLNEIVERFKTTRDRQIGTDGVAANRWPPENQTR